MSRRAMKPPIRTIRDSLPEEQSSSQARLRTQSMQNAIQVERRFFRRSHNWIYSRIAEVEHQTNKQGMKAYSYTYIGLRGRRSLCPGIGALQTRIASVITRRAVFDIRKRRLSKWLMIGASFMYGAASSTAAELAAPAQPKSSNWKFAASATVKETFDSSVYLQSETSQADRESLVTSFLPQAGFQWNPTPSFNASASYAPEAAFYHSESTEDFVAHRATVGMSGKSKHTAYDAAASVVFIDGSDVGPTWTGPGGAPATGGPAVRDRRDAAVFRSAFRVTQNFGRWFVRPAASLYIHDFQTEHRSTPGYQNYVDRSEVLGGCDLGFRLNEKSSVSAGYRYGSQNQARFLAFRDQFDNTFHRILAGMDGQLAPWLKVSIVLGPEFRLYCDAGSASLGYRNEVNFFVDAAVTISPSTSDTITVSAKQFKQPGFGGKSVYEDLTYDASWKHKLTGRWTAGIGARAYNTDFLEPVTRNDWVLSPNGFVNCAVNKHLNVEASYSFERGLTHDVNSSGREYTRHLVALGVRYTFL